MDIERLTTARGFADCVDFQASMSGSPSFSVPALVALEECRGLILAARREDGSICAALIETVERVRGE